MFEIKYKKYKYKYKYKYHNFLSQIGGSQTIKNDKQKKKEALTIIRKLLLEDQQQGLQQLKQEDARQMQSNNKYYIFFKDFLWNNKPTFSQICFHINTIDPEWVTEMASNINLYSNIIPESRIDVWRQQLKTNKNPILQKIKEKIYLDFVIFLQIKYFKQLEIENTEAEQRHIEKQRALQFTERDLVTESDLQTLREEGIDLDFDQAELIEMDPPIGPLWKKKNQLSFSPMHPSDKNPEYEWLWG